MARSWNVVTALRIQPDLLPDRFRDARCRASLMRARRIDAGLRSTGRGPQVALEIGNDGSLAGGAPGRLMDQHGSFDSPCGLLQDSRTSQVIASGIDLARGMRSR